MRMGKPVPSGGGPGTIDVGKESNPKKYYKIKKTKGRAARSW